MFCNPLPDLATSLGLTIGAAAAATGAGFSPIFVAAGTGVTDLAKKVLVTETLLKVVGFLTEFVRVWCLSFEFSDASPLLTSVSDCTL